MAPRSTRTSAIASRGHSLRSSRLAHRARLLAPPRRSRNGELINMPRTSCVIYFIALLSIIVLPAPASSDEADDLDKKVMLAASVVMSMNIGYDGPIDVIDRDSSRLQNSELFIKRTGGCKFDFKVNEKTFTTDFSLLGDRYNFAANGNFYMSGSSGAQCFYFSEHEKGCRNGMFLPYVTNQQRLLDNLQYLIDHGCGPSPSARPDPY